MEVWVLEKYLPDEEWSETIGVFEDVAVGMNTISFNVYNVTWTQHNGYWDTNKINDTVYIIQRFEVVLDEMPNKGVK